jgi:hypothetical protein
LLAYHDRSDGRYATLVEMAFAGHVGVSVNLDVLAVDPVAADWGDFKIRPAQVDVRRNELILKALFAEELGAVLQIRASDKSAVMDTLRAAGLGAVSQIIGRPNANDIVEFWCDAKPVFSRPRGELQKLWSETSWRIARLRDNGVRGRGYRPGTRRPRLVDGATSIRPRTSQRHSSRVAHARASRSCASKASTARPRWPGRSIAPASRRSTCT